MNWDYCLSSLLLEKSSNKEFVLTSSITNTNEKRSILPIRATDAVLGKVSYTDMLVVQQLRVD